MKGAVLQVAVVLGLFMAVFFIGYYEGRQATKAEYQKAVLEAQAKAKAEAEETARKNAEAYGELVGKMQDLETRNRSLVSTASRLSERLRASGVSSDDTDTCRSERIRRVHCEGLLAEGVDLLGEGAGLSERIAAKKDAIVKLK